LNALCERRAVVAVADHPGTVDLLSSVVAPRFSVLALPADADTLMAAMRTAIARASIRLSDANGDSNGATSE